MLCSACLTTEAIHYRLCGHVYCDECWSVLEFKCRESHCSAIEEQALVLQHVDDYQRQSSELEQIMEQLEIEHIKKLDCFDKKAESELEKLLFRLETQRIEAIKSHKTRHEMDRSVLIKGFDNKANILSRKIKLTDRLFLAAYSHQQMIQEGMSSSILDERADAMSRTIKLSKVDLSRLPKEGTEDYLDGKTILMGPGPSYGEHTFALMGKNRELDVFIPKNTRFLPGPHSRLFKEIMWRDQVPICVNVYAVSQTRILFGTVKNSNIMIVMLDLLTNTFTFLNDITSGLAWMVPKHYPAPSDSDFPKDLELVQVSDYLYKLPKSPPIYILNDLPEGKVTLNTAPSYRAPNPRFYNVMLFIDGDRFNLCVPR